MNTKPVNIVLPIIKYVKGRSRCIGYSCKGVDKETGEWYEWSVWIDEHGMVYERNDTIWQ